MLLRSILLIGLGLATVAQAPSKALGQAAPLPAELPAWIRLDLGPAEAPLLADAADGRLDDHDLLAAALVADRIGDPMTQDRYRRQFDGWIAELRPELAGESDPAARGQAVFRFLQRRVLRGTYHESSSSLAGLFDCGEYNCVSSTVVFCCLAEHLQIDVQAAEAPGHVIARLIDGSNRLSPAVAGPREAFRELPTLGLLALAYYNRGVDALESHDFDTALVENIKALRLDPASRTARSNLLAALNNGALAASDQGRHEAALARLRFVRSIAPEF
jgi:tetratricopeptide (TPR) repeat protein